MLGARDTEDTSAINHKAESLSKLLLRDCIVGKIWLSSLIRGLANDVGLNCLQLLHGYSLLKVLSTYSKLQYNHNCEQTQWKKQQDNHVGEVGT